MSHGVVIGVRSNEPSLLARVPACLQESLKKFATGTYMVWYPVILPPGSEAAQTESADVWFSLVNVPVDGARRTQYQIYEEGEKIAEGFRLQPLLDRLDTAMRLQVGRRSPNRLFVHAGVIAWKDRGIVLPGRSGAGKTTLVGALIERGATYYSDEYAVLDDTGLVHPYTRGMSFRRGSHRRVRRDAEQHFGASHGTAAIPIDIVVHTRYRAGAVWNPRVLTRGEAALACFANTLAARERPAFAFSVLSNAFLSVVAIESDRGEASFTADAIISLAENS